MTYPYNPAIPNPPDDPADDVATMQANAAAIGGFVSVDHVPFNTINGGLHNQVTFLANQASPPGLSRTTSFGTSTGVGVLYANLSAGQSYPFWQNALGSFQLLGPVFGATSGSVVFPGGIIFKWGQTPIPSGSSSVIPVTFAGSGGNFNVNGWVALATLVTKVGGTSSSNNTISIRQNSLNTAGFTADFNGNSGSFTFFNWIAIGN
jgi:hypothetical protein